MRYRAVLIACILLSSMFSMFSVSNEPPSPARAVISAFTSHAPISINGNGDFTGANGVVSGSGTASDPYIIEGWDISASASDGISIANADRHFIIRSCYVHDGSPSNHGILLTNCSNGSLSDNSCSNNWCGIELITSNGINLIDNICSNNQYGIILYLSSKGTNLTGNNCSHNFLYGILLEWSNNGVNLTGNRCEDNIWGIALYPSNGDTLSGNNCSSNRLDGLYLYSSSNSNMIFRNNFYHNSRYGVEVDSATYANGIWNNSFFGNNGAGSIFDPSHIQALDNGTNNWWYSSGIPRGYGNYWSDWPVDHPYSIFGSAGARDFYPLTMPYAPALTVTGAASPISGTAPLNVSFTCTPTGGTTLYAYSWDFGDGNASIERNPVHTFDVAGSFNVAVTVTDSASHTARWSTKVTVTGPGEAAPSGIPDSLLWSLTIIVIVAVLLILFLLMRIRKKDQKE